MITKDDLLEAIAECQGTRSPNANTAVKLAAFYTIFDHLYGDEQKNKKIYTCNREQQSYSDDGYSYDAGALPIKYDGTSEFAQIINGREQGDVLKILDDLMSTLKVLNERLYNNVIRQLSE